MATLTNIGVIALSIVCICLPLTLTTASGITAADHMSECVIGGPCPFGRVCAGNSRKKRCVKPMPLMAICKGDPFWVCEAGLECRNGICKPPMAPMGGRCDNPGDECPPGAVCAGIAVKKCVKPMPEGGFCKGDPYWVCAEGLVCRDGMCKKPMATMGGRCDKPGVECMPGTVCAGTARVKKCVKPMPEGGMCKGDPYWVCAEGLVCVDRLCKRMPKMPKRKRCDRPGVVCPPGTLCVGNAVKRCIVPMPVGGECRNDPFWICKPGLLCKDNVCRKPRMPKRKRCDRPGVVCPRGTVCVGNAVKRCVMPMKPGGECRNDPFWICEAGLFCKDNVCTYMVEEGGRCGKRGAMCVAGTKCVGTKFVKKCKAPMPLGGICRKDPFWYCKDGLKCSGGKCVVA